MTQVVPAIIPKTKQQLEEETQRVSGFAKLVQIDISDGVFVPIKSWPYNGRDAEYFEALKAETDGWPNWQEMEFEIHLMVQNPENVVGDWIHTGVSAIVAHIEATNDFQRVIDICRESAVKVGIAIKPSTNIDLIAPFVDKARPVRDSEGPQDAPISNGVDFIQVMGSDDLGKHGVELEDKAVEMIRALRERYPERIIAIDIGVSEETVKILVDAGVTKLISGGAILNSAHPEEVFHNLES